MFYLIGIIVNQTIALYIMYLVLNKPVSIFTSSIKFW